MTTYEQLAAHLSKGLDLCVRARKLDAIDRTNALLEHFPGVDLERFAARHNITRPEAPYETRSGTVALWVQDQYERDLYEWETEGRQMLMNLQPQKAP